MYMGNVFDTMFSYLPNAFLPPLTLLYLVAQIRSGWWQGMLNIWLLPPTFDQALKVHSVHLCHSVTSLVGQTQVMDRCAEWLFSILATNLVTSDFGAGNAELVVRCAIFIEKKNFGLWTLKEEAQDFAAKMFPSRLLMVHDAPRRGQHHLQ